MIMKTQLLLVGTGIPDIVGRVVRSLKSGKTSAVVFHGHPLVYSNPSQMLIRHCRQNSIPYRILSAVSSLDTIFSALQIDVGASGLQMLDVNRMVLYGLRPDVTMPLLVFQIGSFGSAFITRTLENQRTRFAGLTRYLARFYPADHRVQVVECSVRSEQEDCVRDMKLAELARAFERINYNSTLFVPAIRKLNVPDPIFLRRLTGKDALRKVAKVSK